MDTVLIMWILCCVLLVTRAVSGDTTADTTHDDTDDVVVTASVDTAKGDTDDVVVTVGELVDMFTKENVTEEEVVKKLYFSPNTTLNSKQARDEIEVDFQAVIGTVPAIRNCTLQIFD